MSKPVPFIDLTRIHHPLAESFHHHFDEVLNSSGFVLSPHVAQFEKAFASYCEASYAVGVGSGLDALRLALQALEVGPGDEVIVPAHTFIASALAVSQVGARPVLVDVEEASYNLDPQKVEAAITSKTKALMAVHIYGLPADMDPLLKVAGDHGLKVIEDSAQAHGARYKGRRCGGIGDVGCFSFYPTKNLGSLGEGGAIVTADKKVYERVQWLRNVGQRDKNEHVYIGWNSRLQSLQAGWLNAKLPHLDQHNQMRRQAAEWYTEELRGVPNLALPQEMKGREHVYHLYVVRTESQEERDRLQAHLKDAQIGSAVHYPTPIHHQPCYLSLGYKQGEFAWAERLSQTALSLPMFPGLTREEVQTVAQAIRSHYNC